MVFGLSLATFTLLHVIISLIAILTGLLAAAELIRGRVSRGLHGLFLVTTVATSVTGFFFPSKFGPAHVIGILSLPILAVALYAYFARRLAGGWRRVYVVSAFAALYFNVFVAVVQSFQKVSFVHALAPTQKEPPFAAVQGVVLLAFMAAGVVAYRRTRSAGSYAGSGAAAVSP